MEKTNLESFKAVDKTASKAIEKQFSTIDLDVLKEQQLLLQEPPASKLTFSPYTKTVDVHRKVFKEKGKALIREGKVGCILVAGGQGTRLGFSGPKGCCPVTAVKQKTLFHYFSERVKAASQQAGIPLKMAVMTSPKNHAATLAHFLVNDQFGLLPEQVGFFQQTQLPILNQAGELFLESPDKIAFAPDGNGSCIQAFYKSPLAKLWKDEGIHYITFILIDNPLADPFDPYLIGAHATSGVDVTLKCMKREDPEEKLGVIVEMAGKPQVVEYTEISEKDRVAKDDSGDLLYSIANISLFCFSSSFLENAAKEKMPLHKAFKKSDYVSESGEIVHPSEPCVWKFEKFIFDILAFANSAQVAVYPREYCFAPVKDKTGKNSLANATLMVSKYERKLIESITGKSAPAVCLEIDPQFYYPTQDLKSEWKGREIPETPYIESRIKEN